MTRTIKLLLNYTLLATCVIFVFAEFSNSAIAQTREKLQMHHHIDMPPGMIGREQAASKHRLRNHFQSVDLIAPKGTKVSLASVSGFQTSKKPVTTVGMKIGEVYRVKLTNIPDRTGFELYPSIEIINRLYTPRGMEAKFAIPIDFTIEDMHAALDGAYVTRVVYLENPRNALPIREIPNQPQVYDTKEQDPLHVADRLGRPMAILRMGSRVPDIVLKEGEEGFAYGSPPVLMLEAEKKDAVLTKPEQVTPNQLPQDQTKTNELPSEQIPKQNPVE